MAKQGEGNETVTPENVEHLFEDSAKSLQALYRARQWAGDEGKLVYDSAIKTVEAHLKSVGESLPPDKRNELLERYSSLKPIFGLTIEGQ